MTDMTMADATPEQIKEFKELVAEVQTATGAFVKAYEKWGVFWDKMGYEGYRIPIPDGEMERILVPGRALDIALMAAKDRVAEFGVLRSRIQETDR